MEEGNARKNYLVEYEPRRNRLTHDLIYEEFEMVLEDWVKLQTEYDASNCLIKVDGGKLVSWPAHKWSSININSHHFPLYSFFVHNTMYKDQSVQTQNKVYKFKLIE